MIINFNNSNGSRILINFKDISLVQLDSNKDESAVVILFNNGHYLNLNKSFYSNFVEHYETFATQFYKNFTGKDISNA